MKSFDLFFVILLMSLSFSGLSQTNSQYEEAERLFFKEGNSKKAKKIIDKIEIDSTNEVEVKNLKGKILTYEEDFENAFAIFKELTEIAPENYRGYAGQGFIFTRVGQFNNCITSFNKAFELAEVDSAKAEMLFQRSTCYILLKQHEKALEDLKQVAKYDSTNLSYLNNLALQYFELGQEGKAISIMEKVVEIDPEFQWGYSNLGYHLAEMEKYEAAEKILNKGLEKFKDDPYLLNNLGFVTFKLNRVKEGSKLIKKSLKVMESNAYAYRNLALINIHEKDFNEACSNIEKALSLDYTAQYDDEVKHLQQQYCLNKD